MIGLRGIRRRVVVAGAIVVVALGISAVALAFDNASAISVADGTCTPTPCSAVHPAGLYPSNITVSGQVGNPPDITVRLKGFVQGSSQPMHNYDVLLVGPNTGKVILMSDAGDACETCDPPDGQPVVFNDSGPAMPLANTSSILGPGPWHPTNHVQALDDVFHTICTTEPNPDVWPSPGPGAGSFSTSLRTTFGSSSANGVWSLYIVDDCRHTQSSTASSFVQGWSIILGSPTAVKVASVDAVSRAGKVAFSWRTASEADMLGFNVFRSTKGQARVKVNRELIIAKKSGRAAGASYRVVDARARRGVSYTYRLQVVQSNGARVWAGSVSLRA